MRLLQQRCHDALQRGHAQVLILMALVGKMEHERTYLVVPVAVIGVGVELQHPVMLLYLLHELIADILKDSLIFLRQLLDGLKVLLIRLDVQIVLHHGRNELLWTVLYLLDVAQRIVGDIHLLWWKNRQLVPALLLLGILHEQVAIANHVVFKQDRMNLIVKMQLINHVLIEPLYLLRPLLVLHLRHPEQKTAQRKVGVQLDGSLDIWVGTAVVRNDSIRYIALLVIVIIVNANIVNCSTTIGKFYSLDAEQRISIVNQHSMIAGLLRHFNRTPFHGMFCNDIGAVRQNNDLIPVLRIRSIETFIRNSVKLDNPTAHAKRKRHRPHLIRQIDGVCCNRYLPRIASLDRIASVPFCISRQKSELRLIGCVHHKFRQSLLATQFPAIIVTEIRYLPSIGDKHDTVTPS